MNKSHVEEDGFLFYSLVLSSFIESATPEYVNNLILLFDEDIYFKQWLETVWVEEELKHGTMTSSYVQNTWPDFNWELAYELYLDRVPKNTTLHLRKSKSCEALSRCVTEIGTTTIYKTISNYTNEPELQRMMNKMSRDEAKHYGFFRNLFDIYKDHEKTNVFRVLLIIYLRAKLMKNRDISTAFAVINGCWINDPPFEKLKFEQFMIAADKVIKIYFPVKTAQKMAFNLLDKKAILLTNWLFWRIMT